ncbi:MAG: DEAD/DEAH box helicase [Candidatus Woesearchaeota archaeon]
MLKDLTPRPYQTAIFKTALSYNTLAVLPTGLGKTAIAMMVAARRMLSYPQSKVLILAPTKPLVEQHASSFRSSFTLHEDMFAVFTGNTSPAKRHEMWSGSRIIFSTPQALENDVLSGRISLSDVSLLVVDEAHRATGDYAYVFLAKHYLKTASHARLLALTASPGTDKETIMQVCSNLFIQRIEYRKPFDKDVVGFTNPTDVSWEHVLLPDKLARIIKYLSQGFREKLVGIQGRGFLSHPPSSYTKSALLKLQRHLQAEIAKGDRTVELFSSVSLLAQALKLQHAIELGETQTVNALHSYLHSILSDAQSSRSKAVKELAKDPSFLSAFSLVREMVKSGDEHPKLFLLKSKLSAFLKKHDGAKAIIFTQFRDTAMAIQKSLGGITSSKIFFGQAKKNGVGFSQKEQKAVLDQFRNNEFSVLIATSVAEEGLDIPSVDHVFFYEPIPSAIRSVQRRGRTGRHGKGFVTVLLSKGTRDEAFRWVSFHKEKRMYEVLDELKHSFDSGLGDKIEESIRSQQTLSSFSSRQPGSSASPSPSSSPEQSPQKPSKVRIVADFREKGSPVLKSLLSRDDVALELKQLQVGDFVLSTYACVEFKHVSDFVDSIVDGRLLSQVKSLVQYPHPVFIIEGSQEEFNSRKVDPAAINGMLSTIALSYRVPILRTFSPAETARMLVTLASREQAEGDTDFSFHTAKPLDEKSILEYIVGSLPEVGPVLARSLLDRFDSLERLCSASEKDLRTIPLIGKKKASRIRSVLKASYKELCEKELDPAN